LFEFHVAVRDELIKIVVDQAWRDIDTIVDAMNRGRRSLLGDGNVEAVFANREKVGGLAPNWRRDLNRFNCRPVITHAIIEPPHASF